MASSTNVSTPISQTSNGESKFADHSLNFSFVSKRRLSLSRNCSRYFKLRAIKSSNEPHFSSATKSVNISDVPLLSCPEAIERLRSSRETYKGKQEYLAMYSSIFGGITIDPAAMVIPMHDHMVHIGHGVFDTATIMDGHLYELDQHLDRFLGSAAMEKLKLPFDRESIRSILIKTVSASIGMDKS